VNKPDFLKAAFQVQGRIARNQPFYSNLFVTSNCNCRCSFCNVYKTRQKDLGLEEVKHIIDCLADFGVKVVAVTGGEPMLRPDIFEILDYLEERKLVYSMISNGLLWNEEKANEARKKSLFNLSFSLDSLDEKKYQSIRGVNGLAKVKETIGLFKERPLKQGFVNTLTTVNSQNLGEVFDIVEFDRQNNCKFTCGPVALGPGFEFRSGEKSLEAKNEEMAGVFSRLAAQCRHDKAVVGPSFYYQNIADYFYGNYKVPCDAGCLYVSVDSAGRVSPCQDLPPTGNILKEGLKAFENSVPKERIQACAGKTPCFYGCSTFISMLAWAPFKKKLSFALETWRKGML
jgi:MoaA/NifB/PqqE/SkfB family radical SAM enzyme